jgi:hypothetical protein
VQLKKPCGNGVFARDRNSRYLGWEDAFDVEFEDGLGFLKPHATTSKASRIASTVMPISVAVDADIGSHFTVIYDNGQVAEVSGSFIRELPPKK